MLTANALDLVRGFEAMSERTQMFTPGRRRRRERLIRPERHAPAFLSQNARGGQPIRGRERSSRSIYRQGRSAPFTGINNSRDHTIGRRLRGSRRLAPSGWAVTFKPIGPVGRKRLAVVEAEQDRPTALAIGEHAGGLAHPIGQQAYVEATGVEVVEVELVDDKPILAECACPPRLQPRPPYADRHETFCFDDRRRGDQGDETLEKARRRRTRLLMFMLSFSLHTHRRARTYCCPHGPHRHSPPLPVKAGWRGAKALS